MQQYRQSQWRRNARYGLAQALEKQMRYPQAIGEYSQLLPKADQKNVRLDKWMVQARYQMGECYFNLRKYDKAMAEFVSVDTNAQGYPDWQAKSVFEIGRVLLAQKKREDAVERFKEVITRFGKQKAAIAARQILEQLRSG